MILTALNLVFPGAGLFWRSRPLQACWYLASFALMMHVADKTGGMWALYVWIMAQVSFRMARREAVSELDLATKVVIWGTAALLMGLYVVMIGPLWKTIPLWLSAAVNLSLFTPAMLVTSSDKMEKQAVAEPVRIALQENEGD